MKTRRDFHMGGCRAEGLGLTGVRDAEETSSPASTQACRRQQLRQPRGMWWGCGLGGLSCATKQELSSWAWHRVGGRKCLLNECVRWWSEARLQPSARWPLHPGICVQIAEDISPAQSVPGPGATQRPRPSQGLEVLLLSWSLGLCLCLFQLRGTGVVTPQPPLRVPLLTPSSLHCMLASLCWRRGVL